ncbi:dipeptide ABC transporter ATP-binding protein [Streptomyces sirii]|uniref:ABC transporter ATP-binding protein n=1 Tax=Streptomyces sirii TaxID=3127701 RepID=UPI003D36F8FE
MSVPEPVLSVRDLTVTFPTPRGPVRAVDDLGFEVHRGRTLGIVGESGSGKSVTSLAVMGLHTGATVTGSINLGGRELTGLPERELNRLRGRRMAMIFQDPLSSLHPYYTVGEQIAEHHRVHFGSGRRAARERAVEALAEVGIPEPRRRAREYPHQFSGGMRQRVMIAMALACEPELLIADEPTTALDVTVQAQILELIARLQEERGLAVIMITHDLGVVARVAHEVLVMYGGRGVERSGVDALFAEPAHPYTRALLDSLPRLDDSDEEPLRAIRGNPPSLLTPAPGCAFAPRCPRLADAPAEERSRCESELPSSTARPGSPKFSTPLEQGDPHGRLPLSRVRRHDLMMTNTEPLLSVRDLAMSFPGRRRSAPVRAVDGVTFHVAQGETLGLVGESGCGKSTTGRTIVRLLEPTAGSVTYDGRDISHLSQRALKPLRKELQMVFQDPHSSLNPRQTVARIVSDPLLVQGSSAADARKRAAELMELVGLIPEHIDRYPHEFSGGQAQRIGIARALATGPRLVVADEPVSALDVSVQAQIVNLMERLQRELGLAYLFIAHDLSVVKRVCDRVAVMYLGRIVEIGAKEEVYAAPAHPYTRALLSAVPLPDPAAERSRDRITLLGDPPSPAAPPPGCTFHPRCPKAQEICRMEAPALRNTAPGPARQVACHFPETA